ncbi:hypothetical protein HII31_03236 [Pseudocercospora fuligena]|uniref:Uncharacterized protein n=1 Tax=Pseudocercospora fuligena TaxID=685502 RepID=A0A8H6VP49_9PEZI|nr:hypothetical protein HII31_03236 [Pseudocercospora fuligena]
MPIIHSAESGSEWASELGTAVHDIIEEFTSHYRVKESGGSTLFILNNDTDENLYLSFKQEDGNGQWVKDGEPKDGEAQGGEPPPIIPKRSKGIFMLSYSRNSFGAAGSIMYRIGQRDSAEMIVIRYKNDPDGQLFNNRTLYEAATGHTSGSSKIYEASCYRNRHPGGEKPDDDVDIGLTYVRDGEKIVPGAS